LQDPNYHRISTKKTYRMMRKVAFLEVVWIETQLKPWSIWISEIRTKGKLRYVI
jgi:hypothetical protein